MDEESGFSQDEMWEELQTVPGPASASEKRHKTATKITFKEINEFYLQQQPLGRCSERRKCPDFGFFGGSF